MNSVGGWLVSHDVRSCCSTVFGELCASLADLLYGADGVIIKAGLNTCPHKGRPANMPVLALDNVTRELGDIKPTAQRRWSSLLHYVYTGHESFSLVKIIHKIVIRWLIFFQLLVIQRFLGCRPFAVSNVVFYIQCRDTSTYLQKLHDENQRLRISHDFVEFWEPSGVIVEQVPHAAHVLLALQGVFSLSNQPHPLGHNGIQTCVLQNWTWAENTEPGMKHPLVAFPGAASLCQSALQGQYIKQPNFTCRWCFPSKGKQDMWK